MSGVYRTSEGTGGRVELRADDAAATSPIVYLCGYCHTKFSDGGDCDAHVSQCRAKRVDRVDVK